MRIGGSKPGVRYRRGTRARGIATLGGALVLLLVPAAAIAQGVENLEVGDPERRDQKVSVVLDGIVDAHTAALLSPDELPARLADTRLLLVGETHDSIEAHRVQLAVIRELVAAGREVLIGLEMYPYTEQRYLDQWVHGLLTEKGFIELSRWYHNWGFNWGYYRDVFMFARDNGLPVIGVNTPRPVVSAVRQKGFEGLTEEEASHIPPRVDTDNDDHLKLFRAYMGPPGGGHGVSDDMLFSMFEAQCTWDATMAYNSVKALEAHPDAIMVVLVGSGHVSYGLGIQRQAELWFDGEVKTLIPVPVADGDGNPMDAVQGSFADFVWGVAPQRNARYPSLGLSTRQTSPHEPIEIIIVPPSSGAAEAGVEVGDQLVGIDGAPVGNRLTMNRLIAGKNWGDKIVLELEREGERFEAEIVFRRR